MEFSTKIEQLHEEARQLHDGLFDTGLTLAGRHGKATLQESSFSNAVFHATSQMRAVIAELERALEISRWEYEDE